MKYTYLLMYYIPNPAGETTPRDSFSFHMTVLEILITITVAISVVVEMVYNCK